MELGSRVGKFRGIKKLRKFARKNLTTEEINTKLLLAADNEGWTAWYFASGRGNIETLQKLWEYAKENLTREEINIKLLLATDNN